MGRNIQLVFKGSAGSNNELSRLAAELVAQHADVILSMGDQAIIAAHRAENTPVGIVRNAYRPNQSVQLTTLYHMADATVDMLSTVIIGNSQTRRFGQMMVTPRGYLDAASSDQA